MGTPLRRNADGVRLAAHLLGLAAESVLGDSIAEYEDGVPVGLHHLARDAADADDLSYWHETQSS